MCFYDLPGDSKSETGTSRFVGYERTEDIFNLSGGHAASVVRDCKPDAIRYGRSDKQNFAVCVQDGLLGVAKKVKKRLT